MNILGLSYGYHDSAACLVQDGMICSAAQEERFSRRKQDKGFPKHAINYCLEFSGINLSDVDIVAYYERPSLKVNRILSSYLKNAPKGYNTFVDAASSIITDKVFFKKRLIEKLQNNCNPASKIIAKIDFHDHHMSHAASAFFPSPYDKSAILTIDGVGEWASTTISFGNKNHIEIIKEIKFPHSLGLLYSAFTYYAGFKVNSGEYKLMGLAPYGQPKFTNLILDNLIEVKDDGSFRLNMDFFDFDVEETMTNQRFNDLFGSAPNGQDVLPSQFFMDVAASIQKITELVCCNLAAEAKQLTKSQNLCMAGGVALNCVANSAIKRSKQFENIWIQPAAGDSGGSLGAALASYHKNVKIGPIKKNLKDKMRASYLGPSFTADVIQKELNSLGAVYEVHSEESIIKTTSKTLAEGAAVGWMQGRMEFGPRALGNRSILADPRSPLMQRNLNLKIKFRESFRPFAPAVLEEYAKEWFDLDEASPYMLFVATVLEKHWNRMSEDDRQKSGFDELNVIRSRIPAITHIDYTARVQTVSKDTNQKFHSLISEFYKRTGCPMLVNTSFNVRGEPIVCTASDAFKCFITTDLDYLIVDNFLLNKKHQTVDKKNFLQTFDSD